MKMKFIEMTRKELRKRVLERNPFEIVNIRYYENCQKIKIQEAIDMEIYVPPEIINSYPIGTFILRKQKFIEVFSK